MAEPRLTTSTTAARAVAAPLLALPLFKEGAPSEPVAAVDEALAGLLTRLRESGDFRGRKGETLVLYPTEGVEAERVVLVGLGAEDEYDGEALRRAAGAAVRVAEKLGVTELCFVPERGGLDLRDAVQAAAEGVVLAAWDYRELKTEEDEEDPRTEVEGATLLVADGDAAAAEEAARAGRIVATAENLARELAAKPANVATPTHLAEVAQRIADAHDLTLTVLDRVAMKDAGMGALLAVASGTEEEPRFIVLEHRGGGDEAPLALVGKGVTFDSGGSSIKPADKMEEMKYDMSGAAAVLGAMQAIAGLGLPVNVIGVMPTTENLPSCRAVKPGDVVTSHAGKTVEVINTDAEGRLILADALSYARSRWAPRAMLDVATLTGAVVIGLGHHAIGLMGSDDELVGEVRAAGERTGERCWPLPLWKEYRKQLDSEVADLKNVGGRPAGTVTAGWFLREFVGDVPWAHLDIAGTAWKDEALPYLRKGPTGVPTRLFVEWVRARAEG